MRLLTRVSFVVDIHRLQEHNEEVEALETADGRLPVPCLAFGLLFSPFHTQLDTPERVYRSSSE